MNYFNMDLEKLLKVAINAALKGGKEILEVYNSDFAVEEKDDKSPLTLADKNAHLAIQELLDQTTLPVLSEEGSQLGYEERKQWDFFWMVDPLDGTKEFIKRNGEFTVNIALIKGQTPIMGVIYVPVKDVLYYSIDKAYKVESITPDQEIDDLQVLEDKGLELPVASNGRPYTVVGSRSHMSEETESFINEKKKEHGDIDIISMGSSLKLCLVAEGKADVYPRYAPTMEWDTAAGHAIALGAGKQVINYNTNQPMVYNKENLLNDWFIVK